MKLLFEINTTFYKPVYLSIDENQCMNDLAEEILLHIERYSSLTRYDIADIFIEDEHTTLSIPNTKQLLHEFVTNHSDYFRDWNGCVNRNIHKVFVIDHKYLRQKINKTDCKLTTDRVNEAPPPLQKLVNTLKTFMPTVYI